MQNYFGNKLVIGIVAAAAFAAGIYFGVDRQKKPASILVQDRVITVLPTAKDLRAFDLVTGDGKPFNQQSLREKYSLVFFGYTSCPDICPTTLSVLGRLYDQLEKQSQSHDMQVVFVSVDPDRDQGDKLQQYVTYFNKNFIGVSGDEKQIANFAGQLSASYEVMKKGKSENYGVNHTGLLFIVNPAGKFAAILSPPHEAELIESRIRLLKQLEKR